jgi:hypothetical protein
MQITDKHMIGFEKEQELRNIWLHPDIRERLYMWNDFMRVAQVFKPVLCDRAFERRPCERMLRYIGSDNLAEPSGAAGPNLPHVHGKTYHSLDFNGSTYTIRETGSVIGFAYFEVI